MNIILEDDITPTSPEEYYLEGSRFKISCYYIVKSDFLLWHRQYSGSAYQFLFYTTVTSKPSVIRAKPKDPRLSVNLNEERTCVDLDISSAEVTDSALYYCALRSTVTGNPNTPYNNCTEAVDNNPFFMCNFFSFTGCRAEENATQPTEDVMVLEGQPTKLSCTFDTTDRSPTLFWHKQQANGKPMFMLRKDTVGVGETAAEFKERFHARLNVTAKSVPLMIQRVQMSDSAVYYCALKPTVTTGYTAPLQKEGFNESVNGKTQSVPRTIQRLKLSDPAVYYCTLMPTVTTGCGSHGNDITPTTDKVFGLEGDVIKLFCNYSSASNLQWYRQYPGSSPIFLLLTGVTSNPSVVKAKPEDLRLSEISSAEVTDPALYYCALQPTQQQEVCCYFCSSDNSLNFNSSNITHSCTYSSAVSLQWYLQDPGSAPQYILFILHGVGSPSQASGLDPRLSVKLNDEKNRVDLEICSAKEQDSAIYYCARGSFQQTIQPNQHEVYGEEGSNVQFSCNYSSAYSVLWYKQYPGSAPQFLLFIHHASRTVVRAKPPYPHLTVKLNKEKTRVDREISSAELTDSVLYYFCVRMSLILLLLLSAFVDCRGEEAVDQQSGHVTALEGGLVTLSCNYTTSSTSPNLFWYIQLTRDSPQYVLRRDRYSEGSNSDEFKKRFDSRLNFTSSSVPLTIQRLQLSDSAVYYCALKPTVTTGYTAPLQKRM
ncbi:unnamed protein product [Coregonus sp. 'balchen']|nr:unnamed protein product [Coregonus sp. 'balchen']